MADPNLIALNTATLRQQWTLSQCIEGCARHRFAGISPWRDMLSDMGVTRAATQIRDAGLQVTGLCRGGMFTVGIDDWQAMIDDNRRAIDEAAAIGAQCLVLVVGGVTLAAGTLRKAHLMVVDAISELLPHARAAAIPLAIEPLHPMYAADRSCVNRLDHALDLCDVLGAGVMVALDVYHLWWDDRLERAITRAGDRIAAFHVCDWLRNTSDFLLDRGMMGDGVIDIPRIRGWVEDAGYAGLVEVEIFSQNDWWRRDPDTVMQIIRDRVRDCV